MAQIDCQAIKTNSLNILEINDKSLYKKIKYER